MTAVSETQDVMPTEREKMLAGDLYDPLDPELVRARERARDLCQTLNNTRESQQQRRRSILTELIRIGRRYGLDAAAVLLRLRYEHTSGRRAFSSTSTASCSTCAR